MSAYVTLAAAERELAHSGVDCKWRKVAVVSDEGDGPCIVGFVRDRIAWKQRVANIIVGVGKFQVKFSPATVDDAVEEVRLRTPHPIRSQRPCFFRTAITQMWRTSGQMST